MKGDNVSEVCPMRNKVTITIVTVLIILFSCLIIFAIGANRPAARAKAEAVEIAKSHTDLKDVSTFYWFTREESYFSLLGNDSKNNEIIVMIPQNGEKVIVLNQADGLKEDDAAVKVATAKPEVEIMRVNLGMAKGKPSWEVVAKNNEGGLNYYLVDFKSGNIVDSIEHV